MPYSYETLLEREIQSIQTTLQQYKIDIIDYAIGVDPAFGGASETGIILSGKTQNGKIIVLGDFSAHHKPETWIYCVQKLAMHFQGTIVIEVNHGGHLLTSIFNGFSLAPQRALKSKYERAMSCYLLYKNGIVIHLHPFPQLEEQMLYFQMKKKDRVDALVWVVTYLQTLDNSRISLESISIY